MLKKQRSTCSLRGWKICINLCHGTQGEEDPQITWSPSNIIIELADANPSVVCPERFFLMNSSTQQSEKLRHGYLFPFKLRKIRRVNVITQDHTMCLAIPSFKERWGV